MNQVPCVKDAVGIGKTPVCRIESSAFEILRIGLIVATDNDVIDPGAAIGIDPAVGIADRSIRGEAPPEPGARCDNQGIGSKYIEERWQVRIEALLPVGAQGLAGIAVTEIVGCWVGVGSAACGARIVAGVVKYVVSPPLESTTGLPCRP